MVRVIAGPHKGAEGKILAVLRAQDRVIVENVNITRKTQRPTQENPHGGFLEREAPIHVSNVMILDPQSGKPTRIGHRVSESGRKIRVSVASGAPLDE